MLNEKLYVQRGSQLWREMFQPIYQHLKAATSWEEEYLRILALRTVCNQTPPVVSDCQELVSHVLLHNYFEYLRRLKSDQRHREKHREKLQARGIPPEQFFLHPYKSRAEKKRDAEHLLYIENCLRTGRPIQWDNFRRR